MEIQVYPELETQLPEPELDNIIKSYLSKVSFRDNKRFYDNVIGEFSFNTTEKPSILNNYTSKALVDLQMDTPNAEIIVGRILLGLPVRQTIYNDVGKLQFARKSFKQIYVDKVKFLNAEERERKVRGKEVKQILNPQTNRFITIDKRKFRSLYNQIKLRGLYIPLNGFDNIEYKQDNGACVVSALKNIYNILLNDKKLSKILGKSKSINEGLDLQEILIIAEKYKLNVICKTITNDDVIRVKNKKSWKGKCLEFVINNNHLYLVKGSDTNIKRYRPKYINNIDDIKGKYNTYYTDNLQLYKQLKETIKNKNNTNYTHTSIIYNNNNIVFDNLSPEKCKYLSGQQTSFWGVIDSMFNFTSYMSLEMVEYFKQINPVRYYIKCGTSKKNTKLTEYFNSIVNINIDQNKSYYSQLLKNIRLPITCINDKFVKYNNEKIKQYAFYNIDVKYTDIIIAPTKNLTCSGYTVEKLKKQNRIKKIRSVFTPSKTKPILTSKIKKLGPSLIIRYIGWLSKTSSTIYKKFDNVSNEEYEALRYLYGDKQLRYENNTLSIVKSSLKNKTGILVNLIVKELTNIDLYDMNKKILKLNKGLELRRIYTDCLGYFMPNIHLFKSPPLNKNIPGCFKNENKIKKIERLAYRQNIDFAWDNMVSTEYQHIQIIDTPIIENKKLKKCKDIVKILDKRQGFKLLGGPGYGKTYSIQNIIIPYFIKNKLNYQLHGATNDNSEMLNTNTFHKEVSGLSNYELECKYKDIDYIIIDEASQLTQSVFCKLYYIKENTNTKIILVGDQYQCISVDAFSDSWLVGDFCNKLCDYNVKQLVWHKNSRYSKILNDILEEIKKYIDSGRVAPKSLLKFILKHFKQEDDGLSVPDGLHLGYNVYLTKEYNNIKTIHTAQGKTISTPYHIYQIENRLIHLPRVLYTALSRASDINNITIIRNDPYIEKKTK